MAFDQYDLDDPQDNTQEPTDEDLNHAGDDLDLTDPLDKKREDAEPPSVKGEEDPFSGDSTSSESPDIDAELAKVGLHGDDPDGAPDPLGVANELDDEVA